MDAIKRLAERLSNQTVQPKPQKAPHTLSLNHQSYRLLWAYCRRKELIVGDVISDLIRMLLDELMTNGELTSEDQAMADSADKVKEVREEKKDNVKKVG